MSDIMSELLVRSERASKERAAQEDQAAQTGNSRVMQPDNRDCNKCIHDGECYATVLMCKGFQAA